MKKMKIIVEMGHPAHVHHFKNMIWNLEKKGHEIKIGTTDKEVALSLLNKYGFTYEILGINRGGNLMSKIPLLVKSEYNMLKIAMRFKPNLFISRGSPVSAHISRIFHKPHISFNDTEHSRLTDILAFPFSDVICTPSCFKRDLGKKQIRYKGYTELAYLHPNYFKPNPAVLDEIGLSKEDTFIILRFVSWTASHDVGHTGLTLQTKRNAVHEFEKYGRVLITSESPLPKEFEKYRITVSPEKIHDLMYYATLLYGESATMASECAVLGTHAIFSDFAGRGYTDEEEVKYGLVFNFKLDEESQRKSLEKAVELLENNNLKNIGEKKRKKLLKDKIDVTKFMLWFIENYPESFREMEENPKVQERFK